jgi:transcription elongation factor GreA
LGVAWHPGVKEGTHVEKEVILSAEGLRKLEEELDHLKSVRRREVAERIRQAREFGDITENSEYEDAKNEQAFIEGRILTLEKMLRNAHVVDGHEHSPEEVGIGTRVRVRDEESAEEEVFTIVGSTEADPSENKISSESPVGRGLTGHRVGDVVEISVPVGTIRYRLLEVGL